MQQWQPEPKLYVPCMSRSIQIEADLPALGALPVDVKTL